jgi:alkanesulfonate monooxygenase SsuD/methylene tetrahydromethanopterin reductase-like flavin-dependent oxidoreductase (luciferase family)
MGFACVGGRKEIGIYLEALKAAGKDPARYSIISNRVVYIADSEEQAWRETRDALMYQAELYGKWLSAAAGTTDQSKVLIRPDPDRLRRTSVLGTPAEVAARLDEIIESTPMTELIVVTQLPGLDPAKARRSLDRFGAEVLPRIK